MAPSRKTEAQPALPAPWGRLHHPEDCNYHRGVSAIATFTGTPVCEQCARRLAGTDDVFRRLVDSDRAKA